MADVKKVIEVLFTGTDKLSGTFGDVAGGLDQFAGSVQGATQPIADITKGILKTEAAVIGLGAIFAGVAFNESAKFEASQLDLQKVMSESEGVVSDYDDTVFAFSNRFGIAASDVLASAASFRQAGFDINEAFILVEQSLILAIAGELEAAQASEILISTLKGFKAPASEAARLVDVLNEVSNNYATDVKQLGIGMAKISPIADQMGFSFEETAGLLVPVIEVFRSGSEAAVALKTGLLSVIDVGKQEALASIGVAQRDLNNELRSGKDVLLDVSKAFEKLDTNQKVFIAAQIVGKFQAARMVEVFDGLSKSTDVTATAMGAVGSAITEVEIRLVAAEVIVLRAKVAFQNLLAVIGGEFRAELAGVIEGATAIAASFQEVVNTGGLEPLFAELRPKLIEFEELLRTIAENLPEAFNKIDFTSLINSFNNLEDSVQGAFTAVFGEIDLTTPEGLSQVLQKIADSIGTLTNASAGIIKGFVPFLEQVGNLADKFLELDENTIGTIGTFLGMGTSINTAAGLFGGLTGAVSALVDILILLSVANIPKATGAIAAFGGSIRVLLATMAPILAGGAAVAGAGALGFALGDSLRKNIPAIDEGTGAIANFIGELITGVDVNKKVNDITLAGTNLTKKQIEAYRERNKVLEETPKVVETILRIESLDKETFAAILELIQQGTTSTEIIAQLKAEFKDTDSEELIDFVKLQEEIEKIIKFSTEGDQGVIATVDNLNKKIQFFTDEHGIIQTIWEGDPVPFKESADEVEETFDSVTRKALESKETIESALKFQAEVEIERFRSNTDQMQIQADLVAESIKFKAEIDIAEAEAGAIKMAALADNISIAFQTSGDIIQAAFGSIIGISDEFGPFSQQMKVVLESIRSETNLREQEVEIQRGLAEAEIAFLKARTEVLNKGDALITIEADGLEAELEAFMWRILDKIRIRAAADQAEFLLGI